MASISISLAILLLMFWSVPGAAFSEETLGNEIYAVAIPFAQKSSTKEEIAQQFRQYRDARIVEDATTITAVVGGFFRPTEASALLAVFKGKYPTAEIRKKSEIRGDSQPLGTVSRIQLGDAGYDRDIIAYGPRPFVGVSFPWIPGIPLPGSNLILHLHRTPLLKFPSAVTVKISGVTVGFQELSGQSEEAYISIPLAPLAKELKEQFLENRLHVTLEGSLRLFDDPCNDIQSSELWLSLSKDSAIEIARQQGNVQVNSFLSSAFPSLLVVADEKQPSHGEAALTAVAIAKAISPSLPVSFASTPAVNPYGATVVIGDFDEDMAVVESTLYLTPKGAHLLGDRIAPLLATTRAKAVSWKQTAWNETGKPLSFSALGYHSTSISGIGELVVRVPFSLPQIGGYPQSLAAALRITHSPFSAPDKGMIKVRLNGALVASKWLTNDTTINPFTLTFPLPVEKLAQRNQLEVVFTYFADEGKCSGASSTMEATLFEESTLLIGPPNRQRQLLLDSVLGEMHGRGGVLVPDPSVLSMAPLVDWAAMYGELHQEVPDIHFLQNLSAEDHYDYYVVSTAKGDLPPVIQPLVAMGKDIIVRNPLTGETPVQVEIGAPLWVAQTFRHQNAPMLIFSCLARGQEPIPNLTLTHLEHLGGNVAVGKADRWQAMTIGQKLKAVQPDKPDFAYYWNVYKTSALIVLALILLLFFYYVYTHLTGRK